MKALGLKMNGFSKKMAKLKRDPKLFFKDMFLKKIHRLRLLIPFILVDKFRNDSNANYKYAVVSAVYNVEKYLDYFFRTLTRQTIGFSENIHLVMVDDGSTDSSAEIVKKWQEKFPKNITYIYKENGGQASARNVGLEIIESDYVTFVDPDDFVALDYFKVVDDFLGRNKKQSISMISCNLIFYTEKSATLNDSHPLKYRFSKGNRLKKIQELENDIQLSSGSAFFDMDIIARTGLKFDAQVKPNFEDAHFVGRFIELAGESYIAFLADAKYYYRKREDGTSTLDTKWSKPSFFDDVYRYGYIGLVNFLRERGHSNIPKHIQRTLVYDTAWVIKEIINKPEKLSFLSYEARNNFLKYIDEIYASIDVQTIIDFELAGVWFYHKVGLLNCFKNEKPPFQIVYIEEFDPIKEQIKLVYYTDEVGYEQFLIDDKDIIPAYAKTAHHDFLDRTFLMARYIWLPISDSLNNSVLSIQIGEKNTKAKITLNRKQFPNGIKLAEILSFYKKDNSSLEAEGEWLIMDKEIQADDNAEHFYRYLKENYPEQPARFVLRKDSRDWDRLKKDGFNLLAFGSKEHETALHKCGKIISSHADQYVVDYFRDGLLKKKHFVFLQHGVTKDDMSGWLNLKKIDCFITSSTSEFESISGNFNRYKFGKKEVVLTGMPRHDALLKRQNELNPENMILIFPTWRHSLMGKQILGNLRQKNPDFMKSEYAKAWQSLLCSNKLKKLAEKTGYQVVFFPHPNIQPYLQEFNIPNHIVTETHNESSIQDLFCRAKIMITDFSSVAFDIAFLEKSILYFQFDRKAFYSENHLWQNGYFDYDEDGFGPVCFDEKETLTQLEKCLKSNGLPDEIYKKRMAEFFVYRDGLNCERTYKSIKKLDEPENSNECSIEISLQFASAAGNAGNYELAEKRLRKLLESNIGSKRAEARERLVSTISAQNSRLIDDLEFGIISFRENNSTEAS